ncbi:probable inactive receptor kinase At5g67200 [Rhododendron vialii]|uniref:probable inactive receptor kinase At5g67200 n=1 Tax=Rhododendron vialii TaxID=182163 RepID=UPI00265DD1BE|nr:probable inactive receptor kinase At5g67200 [Rhododendron vialii]
MTTTEFLHSALLFLSLCTSATAATTTTPSNPLLPHDASALLSFKSKADLNNTLPFNPNTTLTFCQWPGIQCANGRAVRVVLESLSLTGVFAPNTLTRLDQLRVLSLRLNSLTGPLPDLSPLSNLKSLFLDHNSYTGNIPNSISTLHRLLTLDLSYNNLTGPIPDSVTNLDRLYYLRLDSNRLNGSVPPLNQSSLKIFNVSKNGLTGAVPVTPTLLRFTTSSFSWNPGLCGKIVDRECSSGMPFFGAPDKAAPPPPAAAAGIGQNEQLQGVELTRPSQKKHWRRTGVVVGFSSGVFVIVAVILCFAFGVRKQRGKKGKDVFLPTEAADPAAVAAVRRMEEDHELEEKVKRVQEGMQVVKSGSLVFCAGEAQVYTMDQLMRGSAEMLGKGTMGTTYKAVLDNRLIVSVKRLDAVKLAGVTKEVFERHMESVGGLRHPNLVPLRAYFQAKEERLLVYDYQPNGSLFSLIHGSKSTRAKPLHWTSCLKIAEDVAQGLSYIHQAWRLVHGNLKSSNVLLGSDFEACLTDYCLAALPTPTSTSDPNTNNHRAPETQNSTHQATPKSDVYSFGVLMIELLTGKPPFEHPSVRPNDMNSWVRSTREVVGGDGNGGYEDHKRLGMLAEVAIACSVASPEQRPTMWQVLKMIQEIKEVVVVEEGECHGPVVETS